MTYKVDWYVMAKIIKCVKWLSLAKVKKLINVITKNELRLQYN